MPVSGGNVHPQDTPYRGLSGFEERCAQELGYGLGRFEALDTLSTRVRFEPSVEVFRLRDDPLDP